MVVGSLAPDQSVLTTLLLHNNITHHSVLALYSSTRLSASANTIPKRKEGKKAKSVSWSVESDRTNGDHKRENRKTGEETLELALASFFSPLNV